jgi:hypothetical protein
MKLKSKDQLIKKQTFKYWMVECIFMDRIKKRRKKNNPDNQIQQTKKGVFFDLIFRLSLQVDQIEKAKSCASSRVANSGWLQSSLSLFF